MKIGIFKGKFDPLTAQTVKLALNHIKKYNLKKLYFLIENNDECIADEYRRYVIAKTMVKAYRKLDVIQCINCNDLKDVLVFENEDTNSSIEVQNGKWTHMSKRARNYMISNGLYGQKLVFNKMYEKRYNHSLSVASLASVIAHSNNLDGFKAYLSGLYHDIAKCMDKEEIPCYMNIYKPYECDYPLGVAHQYLAAYILKHDYCLYDKDILKAIRHHCLGDEHSAYSMILYIADKLDPARGNNNEEEIKLACTNLKKCYEQVKKRCDAYYE